MCRSAAQEVLEEDELDVWPALPESPKRLGGDRVGLDRAIGPHVGGPGASLTTASSPKVIPAESVEIRRCTPEGTSTVTLTSPRVSK